MAQEKVLIVEDEENERTGLAELVRAWGYETETASDGVEGLETVEFWNPSIVITDLRVPEMGGLEPGLPVRITWDALPNRFWQGKTEIIPKQVVARGSRSVGELLCSVDNNNLELLPNTNVNVKINLKERMNVITVPRGAVETETGKRYVFVVHNGVSRATLEKREIQVGIADATSFEVISGLQGNETVALPGDVELRNGMVVRVVNIDTSNVKEATDEVL